MGNQYAGLGVTFSDLNDTTLADTAFLSDGVGLNGHGAVTLRFSSYLTSLGAMFPGALTIQLFSGGSLVGTSAAFGGQGDGFFGGVISDIPFNGAILSDWSDGRVFLDNLYLQSPGGPSIPDTGSTTALFASSLAALAMFACFLSHHPKVSPARRLPSRR